MGEVGDAQGVNKINYDLLNPFGVPLIPVCVCVSIYSSSYDADSRPTCSGNLEVGQGLRVSEERLLPTNADNF